MDHEFEPSDMDRLGTFAIATAIAMVVLAVSIGSLVYALEPGHGAAAAYGIGAFFGFWIAPLPGGVASCAVHDRRAHPAPAEQPLAETSAPQPTHAAA